MKSKISKFNECFSKFGIIDSIDEYWLEDGSGQRLNKDTYNKMFSKTNNIIYLKKSNNKMNFYKEDYPMGNIFNNNRGRIHNQNMQNTEALLKKKIADYFNKSMNQVIKSIMEYDKRKVNELKQQMSEEQMDNYLRQFSIKAMPISQGNHCSHCDCELSLVNHYKCIQNSEDICQECMNFNQLNNNMLNNNFIYYPKKNVEQKLQSDFQFVKRGEGEKKNKQKTKNCLEYKDNNLEEFQKEAKKVQLLKKELNDIYLLNKKYSNAIIEEAIWKYKNNKVDILNYLLKMDYIKI